jgi:myo-inositol-1(or 4)-monophosphatase
LDIRKTGSAAIECAYVAAGLLSVARFERPNVWDVAAGIALVKAAGLNVYSAGDGAWHTFVDFPGETVRTWRQPLILGEHDAVRAIVQQGGSAGYPNIIA